jgi:hypothetical protein
LERSDVSAPEPGSKMQRFLRDQPTAPQDLPLAVDLRADASFDEAEGVHVLQLGLHAEIARAGSTQGDVGVAAQRALLHVHVADTKPAQRRAEQLQPIARLLGGAQIRLAHDLSERRAGPVEVDERRV